MPLTLPPHCVTHVSGCTVQTFLSSCPVGLGGKASPWLRRGSRTMFGVTTNIEKADRRLRVAIPLSRLLPLTNRAGLHHAGVHAARVLSSFPELIPSCPRQRRYGESRHPERAGSWPTPALRFKAEGPHTRLPWRLNSRSVPTRTPRAVSGKALGNKSRQPRRIPILHQPNPRIPGYGR